MGRYDGCTKELLTVPIRAKKAEAAKFGFRYKIKARDGDRTRDPLLGKEVLHR